MTQKIERTRELSVVIPLHNEAESLVELHEALITVLKQIPGNSEIIYVDDGSTDSSYQIILNLRQNDTRVRGIQFRRRYGKSAALNIGLERASGETVITMDADLQDDPSEIPSLLKTLDKGYDMVCGWRRRRSDVWSKRAASSVFNWVLARASGLRLHDFNTGLKVFHKEVTDQIRLYGELHRYLPMLAAQNGFRVGETQVNHRPRRHGRSRYGTARYLHGGLDLLTVLFLARFRVRPLHLFGLTGLGLMLIGGSVCAWLAWERLVYQEFLKDRPLLLLGVLLLVIGMQFFSIGLLGEVMSASNVENVKYSIRHDTGRKEEQKELSSRSTYA